MLRILSSQKPWGDSSSSDPKFYIYIYIKRYENANIFIEITIDNGKMSLSTRSSIDKPVKFCL